MTMGSSRRQATAMLVGAAGGAALSNVARASPKSCVSGTSRQITIEARPEPITIDLDKTAAIIYVTYRRIESMDFGDRPVLYQ